MSRNFTAEPLSYDHKPDRVDERRRIQALGAVIAHNADEADFLRHSACYQWCFLLCGGDDPRSDVAGPNRIYPGIKVFGVTRTRTRTRVSNVRYVLPP
jgi:hypothetical protein